MLAAQEIYASRVASKINSGLIDAQEYTKFGLQIRARLKPGDIYVCDSSSNKTRAIFFSQKRTTCSDLNLQTVYIQPKMS